MTIYTDPRINKINQISREIAQGMTPQAALIKATEENPGETNMEPREIVDPVQAAEITPPRTHIRDLAAMIKVASG